MHLSGLIDPIWGFPKISGTFAAVPLIVCWGFYAGTAIYGDDHMYQNIVERIGIRKGPGRKRVS